MKRTLLFRVLFLLVFAILTLSTMAVFGDEEITLDNMAPLELKTDTSLEAWQPPRIVDGIWVTASVSDEKAKEYAAEDNVGQTKDEIRQGEWEAYWKAHWREADAPEWAKDRGQRAAEREIQREQEKWIAYRCPMYPAMTGALVTFRKPTHGYRFDLGRAAGRFQQGKISGADFEWEINEYLRRRTGGPFGGSEITY